MTNIKGFLGAASVAAVAALGMSSAALADDENKFGYSITITGTSDYIFRGVSYTSGDPAFQPFIEFTYGKPDLTWYLDFWGSNVKDKEIGFGGDPWELDIYAGVRPVTGPVSWDLGVLYYTNPDASTHAGNFPGASNLDYVEFKIAASYSPAFISKNLTLSATGYMTPNQTPATVETWTGEFGVAYTLPEVWKFTPTASALFGTTSAEAGSHGLYGGDHYNYWNAGLKLSIDKYFMDFRYWDTDLSKGRMAGISPAGYDGSDDASARFVFSAGVNLP
jgi:uncharacterized protein (TIGR02001 family)